MKKIKTDELLMFVRKSGKRRFKTPSRGSEFFAESKEDGIRYIPNSTGKPREHPFKYLNRVVNRFNQTGSFKPGDYVDLTVNASYTLTLISEYLRRGRKTSQETKFPDFEKRSAMEGYLNDRKYLFTVRNRPIVEERKKIDGFRCQVCRFKLKVGGKFIIECHHKKPFYGGKKRITNIEDLVCLCPTCHRIAHIRKRPYSVGEIKFIIRKCNSK